MLAKFVSMLCQRYGIRALSLRPMINKEGANKEMRG
jgi:hypothetical protein